MALHHCPFCPFSDYDSSFLIQHVELSHPEDDDDSPFISNNDTERNMPGETAEELVGTTGAPSHGVSFIECECGETGTTVSERPMTQQI